MLLAYKQLTKQLLANLVFIFLLSVFTMLSSLSIFFVRFSIDGNRYRMQEIALSGGDMVRYQAAIHSNTILAYVFFTVTVAMSAFVFFVFYYRVFRSGRRQIGCLKALGFRDGSLCGFFVTFGGTLTFIGGLLGLAFSYPLSDVLLQANQQAYGVENLVKGLHPTTVLLGLVIPVAVVCFVAAISYRAVKGKEAGVLLAGGYSAQPNARLLYGANRAAKILPVKNKLSVRLVLRKPLAVFLVFIAVMVFSTCLIIAYSLNISSKKVFTSQTLGHNYEYITQYSGFQAKTTLPKDTLPMISAPAILVDVDTQIEQTVLGLSYLDQLYQLQNEKGNLLNIPAVGTAVIGPGLREVYGIQAGDSIQVLVGEEKVTLQVQAVALNAQSAALYMNGEELSNILKIEPGAYNLAVGNTPPADRVGETLTRAQRIELLKRDAVSNKISGVINQLTGAVVGAILLFLALYMNFQDNTRDILILHLMGYRIKDIRKLLLDLYRPLVWICFVVSFLPGVWISQSIQKSLSISTGDYMPFGTNIWVVIVIALAITLLYQLVQWLFTGAIKRVVQKEEITQYLSND